MASPNLEISMHHIVGVQILQAGHQLAEDGPTQQIEY